MSVHDAEGALVPWMVSDLLHVKGESWRGGYIMYDARHWRGEGAGWRTRPLVNPNPNAA